MERMWGPYLPWETWRIQSVYTGLGLCLREAGCFRYGPCLQEAQSSWVNLITNRTHGTLECINEWVSEWTNEWAHGPRLLLLVVCLIDFILDQLPSFQLTHSLPHYPHSQAEQVLPITTAKLLPQYVLSLRVFSWHQGLFLELHILWVWTNV